MDFVRRRVRMDGDALLFDFDLNELRQHGRQRVHASVEMARTMGLCVGEIALRLPGLILLELWWRKRDMTFDELAEGLLDKAQVSSYLDIETFLNFVHRRNIEESAAAILSLSVLFLSLTFLTIALPRLLRLYAHALSFFFFAFAHYMSTTYVALEEKVPETVKLTSIVGVERHGFHLLAQLVICCAQSVILRLESDVARICLAMYTAPIIARMTGCPVDKLIVVHNVACTMTMVLVCVYVLHKVPRIWDSLVEGGYTLRTLLATRGLAVGAASIWRRIRLSELLTWAWLTMFAIKCYHEMVEKGRSWRETWPVILEGIAETTNTPLTMLALALTVSCVCHWALQGAQWILAATNWQPQHVLAHSGYMECFFLLLVCTQTGLLGMKSDQKASLLGLVLFIVLSALLHSLFDLVEGQLQILATSREAARGKHVSALCMATALVFLPIAAASTAAAFLPMDLWLCILLSNYFITTIHAIAAMVHYGIACLEATPEGWVWADLATFISTLVTKALEIACTMLVIAVGSYITVHGEWTVASISVLLLQVMFNVIQKIEMIYELFNKRSEAQANLDRLPIATSDQIKSHADVCAICIQETNEDAQVRITPCSHLFHSHCLKRWLSVKQVCPLCYQDLSMPKSPPCTGTSRSTSNTGEATAPVAGRAHRRHANAARGAQQGVAAAAGMEVEVEMDRNERITRHIDAGRDVWPLIGLNYDSDDFDTEDSDSLLLTDSEPDIVSEGD